MGETGKTQMARVYVRVLVGEGRRDYQEESLPSSYSQSILDPTVAVEPNAYVELVSARTLPSALDFNHAIGRGGNLP